MLEPLAALHDAHDARLDLVLAVLLHAPPGLVPLGLAVPLLRARRLLDLYPEREHLVDDDVPFREIQQVCCLGYFLFQSETAASPSPVELRLEGVVDAERVRPLDLLRLGALDEDPLTGLADGQRLQRPSQLAVGDGGLVLDLVVRVGVSAVEEQQHAHLVPELSKTCHAMT